MAVKIKVAKNELYKMKQSLDALDNRQINVGHLDGGEQAWLAAIHEYGCDILVTDAMRMYLHRRGLHLKDSTTHIHIPERSFLRAGFDKNHRKIIKLNEQALANCLLDGNVDIFLESVGLMLCDAIKDYAVALKIPPNHPFTIEGKGRSNPLVDSGDMINALTYEVV